MALAIIELDHVLLDGNATSLWSEHLAAIGWVDGESFLPREQTLLADYLNGERSLDDYLTLFLSPLVGRTAEEVDFIAGPFVEDEIEPMLNNDALRAIAQHRSAGDRVLLFGIVPQFLADAIGERLGIADSLGVALEEQHGFYSGRHDQHEQALKDWAQAEGEALERAHYYAQSPAQIALLESAGVAHVVNAGEALQAIAAEKGWESLNWR